MSGVEFYGYLGSVLVAVSLMMSSIVRLRWINLVGAGIFASYGFIIEAWPVAALNGFIVLIDIYHLWKIKRTPKQTVKTRLHAGNPYIEEVLSLKWPELTKISEDKEVEVTFENSEPTRFQIIT